MKHVIKQLEIIQSNRETHKLIAEALLKYETLDSTQIKSLYETGKCLKIQKRIEEESQTLSYDEVKSKMARRKLKLSSPSERRSNPPAYKKLLLFVYVWFVPNYIDYMKTLRMLISPILLKEFYSLSFLKRLK